MRIKRRCYFSIEVYEKEVLPVWKASEEGSLSPVLLIQSIKGKSFLFLFFPLSLVEVAPLSQMLFSCLALARSVQANLTPNNGSTRNQNAGEIKSCFSQKFIFQINKFKLIAKIDLSNTHKLNQQKPLNDISPYSQPQKRKSHTQSFTACCVTVRKYFSYLDVLTRNVLHNSWKQLGCIFPFRDELK